MLEPSECPFQTVVLSQSVALSAPFTQESDRFPLHRMRRSLPFIVDAVPSPGSVEILPLQGQALKTSFSFSTHGWVDEESERL